MENMTTIRAWSSDLQNQTFFYGCGEYELAPNHHTAAIFRMDNTGKMSWYSVFAGTAVTGADTTSDRCYGISHNQKKGELTALLQIKMTELRPPYFPNGDFYDLALILMDSNGRPKRSVTITWTTSQSLHLTNNALLNSQNALFFSGWSKGYSTRL
jgi:hypothetical protein